MTSFFEKTRDVLETIITIPFVALLLIIGLFLPDKANSIVILGTKRSGKSSLWKGLGGIEQVKANTSLEPVSSFVITRKDSSKVTVSATYDIGGEDEFVANYGTMIKEGSFIYYLVDSNEVTNPSRMKRIRSDLVKIDKVVKKKEIEDSFGFKFILTHFFDYTEKNPGSSEYDLYRIFLKGLEKSKGRGVIGTRLSDDDFKKIMMVAEFDEKKAKLLGTDYIDVIKNEIGG